MRAIKILFVLILALGLVSCSCRTRRVSNADAAAVYGNTSNIPLAGEESPIGDVYFNYDSYVMTTDGKAQAQAAASWLHDNPGSNVSLEGHCDERGTTEYNIVLGSNRAQAVYNYLRGLGVSGDRLSTVSYGEEIPVDTGHTEAAWSQNRRVHFDVQY